MVMDSFEFPQFFFRTDKHESTPLDDTTRQYQPMLGVWLLEMALALGWLRPGRQGGMPGVLGNAEFRRVTGLIVDDDHGDAERATARDHGWLERKVGERLEELKAQRLPRDLPLIANLELMSRLLGLTAGEQMVLAFAVTVDAFPSFQLGLAPFTSPTSDPDLSLLLSRLSGLPQAELRRALEADSPLLSSGLVRLDSGLRDLESKLDVLSGLSGVMLMPHENVDQLAARFVTRVAGANLTLADFPHLEDDARLLRNYLSRCLVEPIDGANVLFYGPPGVGKTEFARALACAAGAELYEIDFADHAGSPIRGEARLRAYRFCQRLLARHGNALLLFDEIEDVFGDSPESGMPGGNRSRPVCKAWINRTLETNPVPTVWIGNRVADLDPAYLRRFDYSVDFPVPPRRVRLNMVRRHLGDIAPSDAWMARMADSDRMTPAQLQRAARVAHLAGRDYPASIAEQTLRSSAHLLQQDIGPVAKVDRDSYDPAFTNTGLDVDKLVQGLSRSRRGALCFYGPAGTGKSELARYLSQQLDKPLLLRRASDILSKWVGGTEQNIAAMFAQARREEAVLVLDEADSFLADRRDAQRSWEVTQVNELLTQMEAFDGIFVCTTNLMEKLDRACLRRFTLKLRFDYLRPEQNWEMFQRELARLAPDADDLAVWELSVRGLERLTPGDFAVARRQFQLLGESPTAAAFYEQLRQECQAKGGGGRIGFV